LPKPITYALDLPAAHSVFGLGTFLPSIIEDLDAPGGAAGERHSIGVGYSIVHVLHCSHDWPPRVGANLGAGQFHEKMWRSGQGLSFNNGVFILMVGYYRCAVSN
jgi:hypothetical protein